MLYFLCLEMLRSFLRYAIERGYEGELQFDIIRNDDGKCLMVVNDLPLATLAGHWSKSECGHAAEILRQMSLAEVLGNDYQEN